MSVIKKIIDNPLDEDNWKVNIYSQQNKGSTFSAHAIYFNYTIYQRNAMLSLFGTSPSELGYTREMLPRGPIL